MVLTAEMVRPFHLEKHRKPFLSKVFRFTSYDGQSSFGGTLAIPHNVIINRIQLFQCIVLDNDLPFAVISIDFDRRPQLF